MRFNSQKGNFPLPVLRPNSYDSNYIDSDFTFTLEVDQSKTPHKLHIDFSVSHPDLEELIRNKNAIVSLAIHCDATYFYEVYELSNVGSQVVTFDEQLVFGNVYFTLIVKAVKGIPGFCPQSLESGFEGLSFNVLKGDILAISEEVRHYYGLPPMQLGADIFELVEQPERKDPGFEVDVSDSKIKIGVGATLNALVQNNMNTSTGRIRNISSVYFPALIEVLYILKNGEDYGGYAWYEAIASASKCVGVNIEDSQWEPLTLAQHILRYPYEKLLSSEDK